MTSPPIYRRPQRTASGIELPRVDHRPWAARRFRNLVASYEAELGRDQLTEADKASIRQIAPFSFASSS